MVCSLEAQRLLGVHGGGKPPPPAMLASENTGQASSQLEAGTSVRGGAVRQLAQGNSPSPGSTPDCIGQWRANATVRRSPARRSQTAAVIHVVGHELRRRDAARLRRQHATHSPSDKVPPPKRSRSSSPVRHAPPGVVTLAQHGCDRDPGDRRRRQPQRRRAGPRRRPCSSPAATPRMQVGVGRRSPAS